MNKNQKGFGIFLLLAVIVIIAAIGFTGWWVIHRQSKANSPDSATEPGFTSRLEAGTHSIDLKASDKMLLPSGAILSLPERDANSVPEFDYAKGSEADKHLSIRTHLEVYHNGYKYKITKGTCHTAQKTFSDYTAVVATDCPVDIHIQKASLPILSPAQATKQYIVTQKNNPQNVSFLTLSANPLLLVGGGDGRVTYPINHGKPYLEANNGASVLIDIVTDYGTAAVSYTVDELIAHTEKRLTVAGSEVQVRPNRITCTPVYLEDGTCPVVKDMFVFDFNYSRQPANNPEVVIYDMR